MTSAPREDIDAHTGTATTGHEWDGIRELNTPLPKWWLYILYATIVWAIGYIIVYPAIPLISNHTPGILGWSSRAAVTDELMQLKQQRAPMTLALDKASFAEIAKDDRLRTFALAQGRAAFGDNCAACHGAGGGGAISYPNLNDDDWIWGGSLEAIQQTILYGVRSTHADTRVGAMPAFGQTGILNASEIDQLANHVRAIGGLPTEKTYDKALGDKIYGENCAACHGDAGKGKIELGAPNLSDKIWLFGSDKASIVQTLVRGRGSMMPAWTERLDGATIKALALYVHALGGGEPSP